MKTPLPAALALILALAPSPATAQFLPRSFYDGRTHDLHGPGARAEDLGVTIGMDRASAHKALERRWSIRFARTNLCRPPSDWYCEGAQTIDIYDAKGDLLGGTVELFIADGRVTRVRWWRRPLDP